MDDRPLLCMYVLVGEDWPECLELGRNRAVAGDEGGLLPSNVEDCVGGVVRPPLVEGDLEGVGVIWES